MPTRAAKCALVEQTSETPCILGVSFGCDDQSQTMWARCRGWFRCGSRRADIPCGYPPGKPFYNCTCAPARDKHGYRHALMQPDMHADSPCGAEKRAMSSSHCPSHKWLDERVATSLYKRRMTFVNVGANKGYRVAEFLQIFHARFR